MGAKTGFSKVETSTAVKSNTHFLLPHQCGRWKEQADFLHNAEGLPPILGEEHKLATLSAYRRN
jgi:hypothetical protein